MEIKLGTLAQILTADQDLALILGPVGPETADDMERRIKFATTHPLILTQLIRSLRMLHDACRELSEVGIKTTEKKV